MREDDDRYFLAENPELDRIVEKARVELEDLSNKELEQLLKQFDNVLNQYADENAYERTFCKIGVHKQVKWFGKGMFDIDDVYITLNVLLPIEYTPLWRLLEKISDDLDFGLCKILALLIYCEAANGNTTGALEAARALDDMYIDLQLTSEGHENLERKRKSGKGRKDTKNKKRIDRLEKIDNFAKELLDEGREKHQLAGIISRQFKISKDTARKDLKELGILEK